MEVALLGNALASDSDEVVGNDIMISATLLEVARLGADELWTVVLLETNGVVD